MSSGNSTAAGVAAAPASPELSFLGIADGVFLLVAATALSASLWLTRRRRPVIAFFCFVVCLSSIWYAASTTLVTLNRLTLGFMNPKLPVLMTTVHMVEKGLFAFLVLCRAFRHSICAPRQLVRRLVELQHVTRRTVLLYLLPLGAFTSLDVFLSNLALKHMEVSLYTVAKASALVFTFILSLVWGRLKAGKGGSAATAAGVGSKASGSGGSAAGMTGSPAGSGARSSGDVALGSPAAAGAAPPASPSSSSPASSPPPSPGPSTFLLFLTVMGIMTGITLCSLRDTAFDSGGVFLAVSAAACSAVRWVVTEAYFSRPGVVRGSPIELMLLVTPFTVLALLGPLGWEMPLVVEGMAAATAREAATIWGVFFGGGVLAFILLLAELKLVSITSALTLNVIGHIKDVVVIAFGVLVFHEQLSGANIAGVAITVLCACLYTYIKAQHIRVPTSPRKLLRRMLTFVKTSSTRRKLRRGRRHVALAEIDLELAGRGPGELEDDDDDEDGVFAGGQPTSGRRAGRRNRRRGGHRVPADEVDGEDADQPAVAGASAEDGVDGEAYEAAGTVLATPARRGGRSRSRKPAPAAGAGSLASPTETTRFIGSGGGGGGSAASRFAAVDDGYSDMLVPIGPEEGIELVVGSEDDAAQGGGGSGGKGGNKGGLPGRVQRTGRGGVANPLSPSQAPPVAAVESAGEEESSEQQGSEEGSSSLPPLFAAVVADSLLPRIAEVGWGVTAVVLASGDGDDNTSGVTLGSVLSGLQGLQPSPVLRRLTASARSAAGAAAAAVPLPAPAAPAPILVLPLSASSKATRTRAALQHLLQCLAAACPAGAQEGPASTGTLLLFLVAAPSRQAPSAGVELGDSSVLAWLACSVHGEEGGSGTAAELRVCSSSDGSATEVVSSPAAAAAALLRHLPPGWRRCAPLPTLIGVLLCGEDVTSADLR